MTALPQRPDHEAVTVHPRPRSELSSRTSALQRLIAAQRALFDYDRDVLCGKAQPDLDRRFALNLERRCAQLRYDVEVAPI